MPFIVKKLMAVSAMIAKPLFAAFVCIALSACSGGGNESRENDAPFDPQNDLPNPYSNGYRVIRETTTFSGNPYSVTDYVYNRNENTITLARVRGAEVSTRIHTLNNTGLIVKSVTPAEFNVLSDNDRVWQYNYNSNGQLISRVDLSGFPTIDYDRDEFGNLIELDGILPIEYTYDVNGQLLSALNTIESKQWAFEFNAAGLLSAGTHTLDDGSVFSRFEVLYDENGNISQITDYNRFDRPIFSDTYEYEEIGNPMVNHTIMRLQNELPSLTNTPF